MAKALARVVDPEMAIGIVDLGLVYEVRIDERSALARITMTTPACPVTELIVEETREALGTVVGPERDIVVEVVWDPPWDPERMSERARSAMGWD
ncbi:metal-sulfur cluster assembly factor [Usitatibacter palustris]|uniref:Fe-S protein maturation auxiliary factor SufT n=1 Tax=Usitatibacter palustris TaxID=2732487 RepID=A0A6M4H433_9PROT|nr:metal-sulfur cluster assembly factor [Usitatibacter palustris]QJR14276.1 Fe-S protein maturation auxiliary factor SufT [Usitatibacter palustris]